MSNYEARVLAVLSDDHWTTRTDLIRRAKADPSRLIAAVQWLIEDGKVEFSKLYRGTGHGSGRSVHVYRKVGTREQAA